MVSTNGIIDQWLSMDMKCCLMLIPNGYEYWITAFHGILIWYVWYVCWDINGAPKKTMVKSMWNLSTSWSCTPNDQPTGDWLQRKLKQLWGWKTSPTFWPNLGGPRAPNLPSPIPTDSMNNYPHEKKGLFEGRHSIFKHTYLRRKTPKSSFRMAKYSLGSERHGTFVR